MGKRNLCGLAGLALLLCGCGLSERLDDFAWRNDEAPLERVLVGADDTPGNQSLLYTAFREAEAAEQSALRARLAAEDPTEAAQEVGEVIYAIDPPRAPAWETMETGIVPGWAGQGYGVARAAREMEQALRLAESSDIAEDDGVAGRARVCVQNTIRRSEQILDLAERALGQGESISDSMLQQIEVLARELKQGGTTALDVEPTADRGCGLQGALDVLRVLAPSPRGV